MCRIISRVFALQVSERFLAFVSAPNGTAIHDQLSPQNIPVEVCEWDTTGMQVCMKHCEEYKSAFVQKVNFKQPPQ